MKVERYNFSYSSKSELKIYNSIFMNKLSQNYRNVNTKQHLLQNNKIAGTTFLHLHYNILNGNMFYPEICCCIQDALRGYYTWRE